MMDVNVFDRCQEMFPDSNETEMLMCITDSLQAANQASQDNITDFLHIIAGGMVFFMQAGFATLCAGAVRIKNVQNTMLKNLLDACGAAVAFFLIGKSLHDC